MGIETFDDHELEAMVQCCGRFQERVRRMDHPSWLTILGPSGVGKTHCANRVWNDCQKRFNWSRFEFIQNKIYWPGFIARLRSGDVYERFREMQRWPMLYLDDVGAERDTTGFASEQLNLILGCRVGRWTIITSNLLLNQMAKIDPRISDRIIRERGNEWCEVKTKSYALRKSGA